MSRVTRKQVVDAFSVWFVNQREGKPAIMRNDSRLSPGEYLGDTSDSKIATMLKMLDNVNEYVNSIHRIEEENQADEWLVFAGFDYDGDGRFIGLRVIPKAE